jgi:polygalacturonase
MNRRQILVSHSCFGGVAAVKGYALIPNSPSTDDRPSTIFNPRSFGAIGDGNALDSPAVNAAIDACTKAGGGVVHFSPRNYLSGTVVLKSNVTLYLEAGAVLLGSKNVSDYNPQPGPNSSDDAGQRHFIFARDAENVGLAGPGAIDGQGSSYWTPSNRKPVSDDKSGRTRFTSIGNTRTGYLP